MDKSVIIMPVLGFIGFVAAAGMSISVYRSCGERNFKKLYTLCSIVIANFIYTILGFFLVYNGGHTGVKVPCLVLGIAAFVSSAAQGIICRNAIENGAMSEDKVMSRCIFHCGLAEILSVAALVYFFLSVK